MIKYKSQKNYLNVLNMPHTQLCVYIWSSATLHWKPELSMTTALTWNLVAPPASCLVLLLLLRSFPWSDARQSQTHQTGTVHKWLSHGSSCIQLCTNLWPQSLLLLLLLVNHSATYECSHWVELMTGATEVLRCQVLKFSPFPNYLSLPVWLRQPHLSQHLRPLLHHEGPFVSVRADIAVMLWKQTENNGYNSGYCIQRKIWCLPNLSIFNFSLVKQL